MNSKFNHCFTNYVNHILNNSPSKITYTFSKEKRFYQPQTQKKAPVDQIMLRVAHYGSNGKQDLVFEKDTKKQLSHQTQSSHPQHGTKKPSFVRSNRKASLSRQSKSKSQRRSKSFTNNKSPPKKQILPQRGQRHNRSKHAKSRSFQKGRPYQKHIQFKPQVKVFDYENSPVKNKKKVWDKGESPDKNMKFRLLRTQANRIKTLYLDEQQGNPSEDRGYQQNRYLKYSPYYRNYLANNQENNSRPKSRQTKVKRSLSQKQIIGQVKQKTVTQVLQQLDHPSKNITPQGYYPLKTQLNEEGKYVSSKYKNTIAHSFGSPPKKNITSRNYNNASQTIKQRRQNYTQKRETTERENNQNYPSIDYFHHHIGVKKHSCANLNKSAHLYTPFSEFGLPKKQKA